MDVLVFSLTWNKCNSNKLHFSPKWNCNISLKIEGFNQSILEWPADKGGLFQFLHSSGTIMVITLTCLIFIKGFWPQEPCLTTSIIVEPFLATCFFKHWSSAKILMSEIRIPEIYPSIIFQCFSKPVGTVHTYNWLISGLLLLFSNFDLSCLTETRFQIFLFWPSA